VPSILDACGMRIAAPSALRAPLSEVRAPTGAARLAAPGTFLRVGSSPDRRNAKGERLPPIVPPHAPRCFHRCFCVACSPMSVCLCSFRALSRPRTPSAKTLAPFLYHTATIQQRNRAPHRNASDSSRPRRSEHAVPFEGEEPPPPAGDASARRRTTITGTERAAFEKLYKHYSSAEEQGLSEHELDQIADEYYEDDDDSSKDKAPESLDSIFGAVLSGQTPKPAHQSARARSRKPPSDMETLAKQLLAPEAEQEKRRKKEEAAKRQTRVKALRAAERDRVKALLEAAPTDHALWAVLEKQVFSVVRGMDLENGPGVFSSKGKSKQKAFPKPRSGELSPTDPTIVYPNYSHHLLTAASTLRYKFPASPLVFNILPTVKSLGRSSYALGANTALYKFLIRVAFRHNHSYTQICSLLQDMDNGGIEYDYSVAYLVDEILIAHTAADKGAYGRGMQAVVRLELHREGAEKLRAWRAAIGTRLGEFAEEKKDKGLLFRRVERNPKLDANAPEGAVSFRRVSLGDDAARPGLRNLARAPAMNGPKDKVLAWPGMRESGSGPHDAIPLVEGDVPFAEERGAEHATEMHADVEGFMVDPPVEAAVPAADESRPTEQEDDKKSV
jgi:hypothetical protein